MPAALTSAKQHARHSTGNRFALALIALFCVALPAAMPSEAAPRGSRWGAKYFPNLPVTSQDGKTYNFYDDLIKDKIVVINFIYTHCPDICGLQTARMAIVQDKLGDRLGKDIFIYSISMDPERDTPEALKKYSEAFESKPGWLFLTGEPEQIHKIRYKLGERSRSLAEHRNDAVLGNDKTGEWGRSSIMANLDVLAQNIREIAAGNGGRGGRIRYAGKRSSNPKHYNLGKQAGQALFLKACAACHTVGMGDHIGPDLEGLTARREHHWLMQYLMAPDRMRKQKDPIAVALDEKYKGVVMPNLSLSKHDVADLLSYISAQTKRLAVKTSAKAGHNDHAHQHDKRAHHGKHAHHKHAH